MKYLFLLILLPASLHSGVKVFKSVKTEGFVIYPSHILFENAKMAKTASGYAVDVEFLEKAAETCGFFSYFEIDHDGEVLKITVEEKKPAYRISVEYDYNHLFEIDSKYEIISSGRVYSAAPLIRINADNIKNGRLSPGLKNTVDFLERLKSSLICISEIEEIDLTDRRKAVLKLRGRRTRFSLFPDTESFIRLEALAGYFDRYGFYPQRVDLFGNTAVLE